MSTQKNGSNGTAPTKPETNGKHITDTTTTLKIVKDEQSAATASDLPPVEDRILKVNQLASLCDKLQGLYDLRRKLKSFAFNAEGGVSDRLTLKDFSGNEFVTSNRDCLGEVLAVLRSTIERKISETETQIRF